MLIVQNNSRVIEDDILDFDLAGMFEPRFVNLGEVDVSINDVLIPADKSEYSCAFTGAESAGKIPIVFSASPGKKKVLCTYGRVVGRKDPPPIQNDNC